MKMRPALIGCVVIGVAALSVEPGAGIAYAQDSVAATPGGNDALSAYAEQRHRYIIDLVPIFSSWGNEFRVGPIIKTTRAINPPATNQSVISIAVSPDVLSGLSFAPTDYALWTTPGAGVHPVENSAPGSSVNISNFDRQFAIAATQIGPVTTNVVGAVVGQIQDDPNRLYVTRVTAASGRIGAMDPDTASLSLGSVEASGVVHMRAEQFNISGAVVGRVEGESVAQVDLNLRDNATVNSITGAAGVNSADDALATLFPINNASSSLNPPSLLPASINNTGLPQTMRLGFDGQHWFQGAAASFGHLDLGMIAHRGNPSYSTTQFLSAPGGAYASLAVSAAGGGKTDSINIFSVDLAGQVLATTSATLPPILSDGAGFTAMDAQFTQWASQVSFRGGNGLVGIGRENSGSLVVSATATDSAVGEFIAVSKIAGPTIDWSIIARVNTPVLDAMNGVQVAKIVSGAMVGSPVTFSAPAVDVLGNVYFICAIKPNLGAARIAFIKAVNMPSGYQLERILATGDTMQGANSGRMYEITRLTLGDSNSVASGSFFSGSLLQPRPIPLTLTASNPRAFSGAVLAVELSYDNAAVNEVYNALLFVGPTAEVDLIGDLNGDGVVGAADLAILLGAWDTAGPVGDINGDGIVNSVDFALLLGSWT